MSGLKAETDLDLALFRTPIDFEQLEKDGILFKAGHRYRISNIHDVPEHVKIRIIEMSREDGVLYIKLDMKQT